MHKMSKRSFAGRLAMLPVFAAVVIAEWLTGLTGNANQSIRKVRINMEDFANKHFPLDIHPAKRDG